MKKLKAAVIGVGGISYHHIMGYIHDPDTELYAFCDINERRLFEKADEYGVPRERCFTDKDEMFKKCPEIDVVSVTTWNCAHAECTIAALNAGKDVICEKPMAMNAKEAQAMKDAADKNGRLLQIGFVRRFGNDTKVVKDFIDAGDFGDLYYAKATYLRRSGNPGGWFQDKSRSGGGPLIDLGVHVIDLVRYLMGCPQPVSVYACTFQKLFDRPGIICERGYRSSDAGYDDSCTVEDLASAMIRFDNGAVLHFESSFSLNIKHDESAIELFGTKAGCKMDPKLHIFTDKHNYLVNVDFDLDTEPHFDKIFENELAAFLNSVKTGEKTIAPAEDGVTLMKILDACYKSAATGHEVLIEK